MTGKSFLFLLFSGFRVELGDAAPHFHHSSFCLVFSAALSGKEVDWSGNSGNRLNEMLSLGGWQESVCKMSMLKSQPSYKWFGREDSRTHTAWLQYFPPLTIDT